MCGRAHKFCKLAHHGQLGDSFWELLLQIYDLLDQLNLNCLLLLLDQEFNFLEEFVSAYDYFDECIIVADRNQILESPQNVHH